MSRTPDPEFSRERPREIGAARLVSFTSHPMTPEPSQPESRRSRAARIARNPGAYQVCEGCDSIVGESTVLCPNCHSFRFDARPERVTAQAELLGSREQRSVTSGDLDA